MKITQEKVDDLNALLILDIEESDYNDVVQNKLKEQHKKVSMPGFRQGKVPFGMVKKMYETPTKVEVINKKVSSKIFEYINENKLKVLGQPLPLETNGIDWENQKTFTLQYEMGLSPVFDINLSEKMKFKYYNVVPDNEMLDNYVEEITLRFGKISNPEIVGEKDLVAVDIVEIDGDKNEEDLFKGIYTIGIERISNQKIQDQLIDKKKDDKITVNIKQLGDDLSESLSILGLKEGDLDGTSENFEITIGTISRMAAADLDQELFDKVYGVGTVTSVDAFRQKVKEEAQTMLGDQGKGKLKSDLIEYFLENLNVNLPDQFMKKWLVVSSQGKLNAHSIEHDYHHYEKSLKWQVIETKLIDDNNIKVEPLEVRNKAKELIKANFAQYGQTVPDEQLTEYADGILKKEEEARRLYDDLYYDKIIEVIKNKCSVENIEISYQAFSEMVKKDHPEHEHVHDENCNHDHEHAHHH